MGKILVSACLVGINCKYNGKNNLNEKVMEFLMDKEYIAFCPEQAGGLTTPRAPSEIREDKVVSKEGEDVSAQFERGAEMALRLAEENDVTIAILKDGSPSCGSSMIYDGSFTGKKTEGMGKTARLLADKGISVKSEHNL